MRQHAWLYRDEEDETIIHSCDTSTRVTEKVTTAHGVYEDRRPAWVTECKKWSLGTYDAAHELIWMGHVSQVTCAGCAAEVVSDILVEEG